MFVVSLMSTPLMNWACPSVSSSKSYCVVVVTVLVCGLADGLIGGSLIGTAGKLPKQYMQAVFAGTASSGMFYYRKSLLSEKVYTVHLGKNP